MKKLTLISFVVTVLGIVTPVHAETTHSHNTAGAKTADNRIAISLPASAVQQTLTEMRMHLEIVEGIISALAKEDMQKVSELAYKLGHMDHSAEVMKRRKMMPEGYRSLGPKMHMGFQAIARDARDFGDPSQTLEQLSNTMKVCTACHQTYRLETAAAKQTIHNSID